MSSGQPKHVDEAQLKYPENRQMPKDRKGHEIPWLTVVGFLFLTFNSGMAVYRSNGDLGAIFFVAFSYVDLVSLFYCLRWYESTPPESHRREHLTREKSSFVLLCSMVVLCEMSL